MNNYEKMKENVEKTKLNITIGKGDLLLLIIFTIYFIIYIINKSLKRKKSISDLFF